MSKIPSDWHVCATCAHWCGNTMPDPFRAFVEYDPNERSRCAGGGFNMGQMTAMASCGSWVQRFRR